MPTIGYLPYHDAGRSAEAGWLAEYLGLDVCVPGGAPSLNRRARSALPPLAEATAAVRGLLDLPAVVAEGPGGFLWAALLRANGYAGTVTLLPYLNPSRWLDVAATAVYRRFADPRDRVFVGSTPSAALYHACGVPTQVGEPYGIDERLFTARPDAGQVRERLRIPPGPLLLYAGRAQPDKDVYRLLRVALKARLLFPDLQVVIASHVTDQAYLAAARARLADDPGVHFVADPSAADLADLYHVAEVFVTAGTSHFETFGRAPAEALACGVPTVAPRYDGFAETLAQPGGWLVDVAVDPAGVPAATEEGLLRAVYDVLSSPGPRRSTIATAAQARFGRSRTITLLAYLAGDAPPAPGAPVRAAPVVLPGQWHTPLAQIGCGDPSDGLAWLWRSRDHDRLGAHDASFAGQVRRLLCVPPREPSSVTAWD